MYRIFSYSQLNLGRETYQPHGRAWWPVIRLYWQIFVGKNDGELEAHLSQEKPFLGKENGGNVMGGPLIIKHHSPCNVEIL